MEVTVRGEEALVFLDDGCLPEGFFPSFRRPPVLSVDPLTNRVTALVPRAGSS
jgi:hypothetical protein